MFATRFGRPARHALALLWAVACAAHFPAHAQAGDTYDLSPNRPKGSLSRVEVLAEVGGELKLVNDSEVKPIKMSVVGKLAYEERMLTSDPRNLENLSSIRHYDLAEATIKIDQGGQKPTLRDDRRLVAAHAAPGEVRLYSPDGPLTRDELDLLDVQANSLLLDALLPETPVALEARWAHDDELLARLLGLDAVSTTDVSSQLSSVDEKQARFELAGKVSGAIDGVATEIELKGRYTFDRKTSRVNWVALLIKEQRSIGHVAPGVDVVARLQMTIRPQTTAKELTDARIAGLPSAPDPALERLVWKSPSNEYQVQYERRWNIMSDDAKMMAMRLVDRGDLVAQCNLATMPPIEPGAQPSPARFQADIKKALGQQFGQFVSAKQTTTPRGYLLYRVVADGKVSELPIRWHYYLLADRSGRQVVFAFTVEPDLVEVLGESDRALVEGLEFTETKAARGTPSPAPRRPAAG